MRSAPRTANQHQFARVPQAEIPRSSFDRSNGWKSTFNSGFLVPFFVDDALPGDTFNLDTTALLRLSTPLHPIMDNLWVDTFYFAVPNRLVWDNWEKFNGAQKNPGDSTDYLVPTLTSPVGGYLNGTLSDYFGLPTQVAGVKHMALFHRAYNLIWNEWFRDQNLQTSLVVPKGDGPDTVTDYVLQRRGKRHDYFTSALPWPQKGPAVQLPLGTDAPVLGIATNTASSFPFVSGTLYDTTGAARTASNTDGNRWGVGAGSWNIYIQQKGANAYIPNIRADLSAATAATINQLRQAFQIQKIYERDARGGTRYTEIIKSHFGVTSPDARLQRPEYLGGSSTPFNVTPIAQTAPQQASGVTTPQGNLGAFGVSTVRRAGFTKSFTEHTMVIGLISVRADLNYQQNLDRMWSRSTRWDFYWPALSHIGEQSVLNKEIYSDGSANDDLVFGYQERHAEYRYKPSKITGQFRSNYATTLDTWHLAQKFTSLPVLGATFIVENPPVDRVVAVPSEPQFICDAFHKYRCARPMPTYAVPGLIDHF